MDVRPMILLCIGLSWACGGGASSGLDPAPTPTTFPSSTPVPGEPTPNAATPTPTMPAIVAWAVGDVGGRGAILRSDDGGRTWNVALLVDDPSRVPTDVAVADARTIAVVGPDLFLRSDDAGSTWTDQQLGLDRPPLLEAIAFAGPEAELLVGSLLGEPDPTSPRPLLLVRSGDDPFWTRPLVPEGDRSIVLRDACLTADGTGITAGFAFSGDLILVTRSSGSEWSSVAIDPARFLNASGVACVEGGPLWIAGAEPGAGALMRSLDGGETWDVRTSTLPPGAPVLADIAFSDPSSGLVVGGSAILSTGDGGESWTREAHPYDGEEATLATIATSGATRIVAGSRSTSVGLAGLVLVDGGEDTGWIEAQLPATGRINAVALEPTR